MASSFIKGLKEKLSILAGDWLIMQPDAEEDTAYKIKKSNVKSDATEPNTWYVNTNGDNSNVGSDKFPFKTIEAAHDAAVDEDVIIIQNTFFSSNENITITKWLTFKGPSYVGVGVALPSIEGIWDINGSNVIFENLDVRIEITNAGSGNVMDVNNCFFQPAGLPARKTFLYLNDSTWGVIAGNEVLELYLTNSRAEGNINIGRKLVARNSVIQGNVVTGIDQFWPCEIFNLSIDGDLTITGNLDQENSTVKGATTVSGTTTGVNQRPYEVIKIPLGARDKAHTTGTNKVGLHIDYNFTFIGLPTLEFDPIITDGGPTGNAFVVDINVADIDGANIASILSTKLSVDAGEFHSSTAATPCVLSSNTIAKYKFISIDIDTIGGTLAGKGGFVTLNGYRT